MNDSNCAAMAAVTRGWRWPVLTTAMPAAKSVKFAAFDVPQRGAIRACHVEDADDANAAGRGDRTTLVDLEILDLMLQR